MKRTILTLLTFGALTAASFGQSNSTSANFDLLSAPPGGGGGQVSSGNISADLSVGVSVTGGVSNVTVAGVQEYAGYTGQLYDPVTVELSATPTTVDEGHTRQLSAAALLDDSTTLALDPSEVAWSVVSGQLTGIGADGLASAGIVFENSEAIAHGSWLSLDADLMLDVINVGADDFGSYAGDGLDDAWQVGFFGEDNSDAAPGENPDGDDNNNQLEYLAQTDPTDPESYFSTELEPTPGEPGKHDIIFSPLAAGRSYVVMVAQDLAPENFVELTGGSTSDAGGVRTVTDNTTSLVRRFYKVEISKP